MFQGVERQRDSIFYILGIEKSDLDEVVLDPNNWPNRAVAEVRG
jgi:hypothetical protein